MDDLKQRLTAISLLDGRNWDKVKGVSEYFSEFALIKHRVHVEIKFLQYLSENTKLLRKFSVREKKFLDDIDKNFSLQNAAEIKTIEKKINHDVKAVEYFLQKKMENSSLKDITQFIHFGLTSYDINIPSYGLMLMEFRDEVLLPTLEKIKYLLKQLIVETKNMKMLGRTHGQPALPTTMGKELAVFYRRIVQEEKNIRSHKMEAKLNGAVGNYNAFYFIDPKFDWMTFSSTFISGLGLKPNLITTQILPYDNWIQFFDDVKRLNYILLGFSVDIWWYISMEYFLQKKKEEEVGSSTMSHKINPITFENAEGNLGLANSMFEFFAKKLSFSRLQRDLTDSTVKRNFGLAFGYTILAWDSLISGLNRIHPNPDKMNKDLEGNWEVFSEGIQTFLRLHGYDNAYELLKEKTRGKKLSKVSLYGIIDQLPIKNAHKKILKIKSLSDYCGLAETLAKAAIQS
ncbi:adenylosuccinate lyase [Candidatus Gottesmanbacteria bacterium]|nr:adenylosuccinate lyase [Candidatus Gottesmanbacteria bacterium]